MKTVLPKDPLWTEFTNHFNEEEYQRICREFDVDHNTPWCVNDGVSLGHGRVYSVKGFLDAGGHDPNKDTFTQSGDYYNRSTHEKMPINIKKLQQDFPAYFWQQFTLNE